MMNIMTDSTKSPTEAITWMTYSQTTKWNYIILLTWIQPIPNRIIFNIIDIEASIVRLGI